MSVIKASYIDYNRSYALSEGLTLNASTISLLTGGAVSGKPIANTQTWDNFNIWEATGGPTLTDYVEVVINIPIGGSNIGSPATIWAGAYNAIGLWFPNWDDYRAYVSDTNILKVEVRISATDPGSSANWTAITAQVDAPNPETININPHDFTSVGTSRFVLIRLDAATTATAHGWINLRFIPSVVGSVTIGASKICVLNMQDMYEDLDQPIKEGIGYDWQDRDFINNTFSGGIKRGAREPKRVISMPTFFSGNQWGMEPFRRNAITNIEPYVLALDYENDLSNIGQHIHTLPVHRMGGMGMRLRTQFSKSNFLSADIGQTWGEWL